MADVCGCERNLNLQQNNDKDIYEVNTPHANNLIMAPVVAKVNINEEISVYNGNITTLSNTEREIDESDDRVVLGIAKHEKAKHGTEELNDITR